MAYDLSLLDYGYEVIEDRRFLMTPGNAWHGESMAAIAALLGGHFKGTGHKVYSDAIIKFGEGRLSPDISVVNKPEVDDRGILITMPDLAVEILSNSTRIRDKGVKKDVYAAHGVKEYWIVDYKVKSIEVYVLKNNDLKLHSIHTILDSDFEVEEYVMRHGSYSTRFNSPLFPELEVELTEVFDAEV